MSKDKWVSQKEKEIREDWKIRNTPGAMGVLARARIRLAVKRLREKRVEGARPASPMRELKCSEGHTLLLGGVPLQEQYHQCGAWTPASANYCQNCGQPMKNRLQLGLGVIVETAQIYRVVCCNCAPGTPGREGPPEKTKAEAVKAALLYGGFVPKKAVQNIGDEDAEYYCRGCGLEKKRSKPEEKGDG